MASSSSNNTNDNNNALQYSLGSNFIVKCLVAPVPPPGSEFSWNCSTGCLDNATMQQSINITELGLLENVMINCSVFINDVQYSSETVEINITGKHISQKYVYCAVR